MHHDTPTTRTNIILTVFLLLFATSHVQAREQFLDIQEHTSPGGISFWLVEDHTIPVVALDFAFDHAGAKYDPPAKQGLARLASNTMDEGAGNLDSEAFQSSLRNLSISLGFSSSRDTFGGSLKTRTETLERASTLLKLALSAPRFEENDLERMRQANIARIRASLSDPNWIAARLTNDITFAGHPYALNSGGTITSLQNITAADLQDFVKTRLAKKALKISIAGDITADNAKALVDNIFGPLPETQNLPAVIEDLNVQNQGQTYLYETDIPQAIIMGVQPALKRTDPDYYAYRVMNQILGAGGFGARLTEEIREKRGLTYGIYTSLTQMTHADYLTLSVSTANQNAGEVLTLAAAEMQKMSDNAVTEEELRNAVSYINGSLPLALSSTSQISSLLLGMQLDALPIDYLDTRAAKFEAVRTADVQNIAKKYLKPDNMALIIVGQPQGIKNLNVTRLTEIPNVE